MKPKSPSNLAHSIHARLLNLATKQTEDFNGLLIRYGLERLLYRLARSGYSESFVLKGAMLFAAWTGQRHRPTRDLDLLGYGEASNQYLAEVFRQIALFKVEPDGLVFDANSIRVISIREDQSYESQRVRMTAFLGNARIDLQIDIGFGDVVTPEVQRFNYPALLDLPKPFILAYPPETVVAEKLQACISLGMSNSRMKDFFDLWTLSKLFQFNGPILCRAVRATFERRKTIIPQIIPVGLTSEFSDYADHAKQWTAFVRRHGLSSVGVDLSPVLEDLRSFLLLPLFSAARGDDFDMIWSPGGPWIYRK